MSTERQDDWPEGDVPPGFDDRRELVRPYPITPEPPSYEQEEEVNE